MLLRQRRREEPAADEVPSLEEANQGLRRGQADQGGRTKLGPWPFFRRAVLDVPRRGRVDRQHRRLRLFQRTDDAWEGLAHLAAEAEAEDCVDDVVRLLQRGREVLGERHVELPQLRGESLVELVLGLLGVVHGGPVAVVREVARGDQAVATVVAGTTDDEHASAGLRRMEAVDGLGDGEPGELHELVHREGVGAHELLVERGRVGGGEGAEGHSEHVRRDSLRETLYSDLY